MLTYLINVTSDLLAVSVVLGVIWAFTERLSGARGRMILRIGIMLGTLGAAVRAYITNSYRLTAGWRVGAWGYVITLGFFLVFVIAFAIMMRSLIKGRGAAIIVTSIATALLTASYLYNALPTVYVYPFKFDTGGNGILSTEYLFRLGGYALGLIVCAVSALCACKICSVCFRKGHRAAPTWAFFGLNALMAVNNFARLMSVLTIRRKAIESMPPFGFIMNLIDPGQTRNTALFNFASFSNNNSHWYTFISFIVITLLAVFIFIWYRTAREPYNTKAEHRKIRALWRTGKRYGVVEVICFVMAILCATWFVKLNTVVIREAPVEEPVMLQDENYPDGLMFIPFEMVSDGHLHRFGYTTPDGNPTRLIVVLKQAGTNNYGIGLDACEICGEAGYYENKDGRVVCKKCNVVMNTTTIGMKGGCNPIIIDYDMNEEGITVPVAEMIKNQDRFKK